MTLLAALRTSEIEVSFTEIWCGCKSTKNIQLYEFEICIDIPYEWSPTSSAKLKTSDIMFQLTFVPSGRGSYQHLLCLSYRLLI